MKLQKERKKEKEDSIPCQESHINLRFHIKLDHVMRNISFFNTYRRLEGIIQ